MAVNMGWFKGAVEYLKGKINSKSKKKTVENIVVVIIIGIIILIAGGSFFKKEKEATDYAAVPEEADTQAVSRTITYDEKAEIEYILSQIDGAGKVNMMVTFFSGKEIVPAYDSKKTENETDEKDTDGGTRSIKENDNENKIVFEENQGGTKKLIVIKEIEPAVKGVIVVADGAGDIVVREQLYKAVQTLMDIPIHKIQVFRRKK